MAEIDRSALPPPEPATPILASQLLLIEETQRRRFASRGERIRTGCGEIDDYLLGGGCERGIVVGISAKAGEGRLISLHLLVTTLLSHLLPSTGSAINPFHPVTAKATVVDTTGSFPLALLAEILKSRILSSTDKSARQAVDSGSYAVNEGRIDGNENMRTVDDEVQRCLEMVAINRVFDVEGLWEVLGEMGKESNRPEGLPPDEQNEEESTELIIIDNMTHLINELFARKERSEAHTVLKTLSRTLHTITHTKNILTLLHNTTVTTTSYVSEPANPYPNPYQKTTSRKQPSQNPQPISIFPSNLLKPACGQIFSQFPDLHLLMSQLPKTRHDAERLYEEEDEEDEEGGMQGRGKEVAYCYVIEVLKDETPNLGSGSEEEKRERKFGGREQRWAAVEISPDGLGLIDAFMAKGNMRGMNLGREKGKGQDVGSVAKIYGFSGRRG